MTCEDARSRIDELFERHAPVDFQRLRLHLRECEACRVVYDRIFDVEQAAQTPEADDDDDGSLRLGAAEAAMLAASVLPAVDARRRWSSRTGAIALATAAAAVVLIVVVLPRLPSHPELTARGGGAANGVAPLRVRPLCVSGSGAAAKTRDLPSNAIERAAPRCERTDSLAFTAHNATNRAWYLHVFVDDGGALRQVYPEDGRSGGAVAPTSDESGIEAYFDLDGAGGDRISIYGVFTSRRLPPAEAKKLAKHGPSKWSATSKTYVTASAIRLGGAADEKRR